MEALSNVRMLLNEFLLPETDILPQFLGPENKRILQFQSQLCIDSGVEVRSELDFDNMMLRMLRQDQIALRFSKY